MKVNNAVRDGFQPFDAFQKKLITVIRSAIVAMDLPLLGLWKLGRKRLPS